MMNMEGFRGVRYAFVWAMLVMSLYETSQNLAVLKTARGNLLHPPVYAL
jgi:hypothetical protein